MITCPAGTWTTQAGSEMGWLKTGQACTCVCRGGEGGGAEVKELGSWLFSRGRGGLQWSLGGPPRMYGQEKGAFFLAVGIHISPCSMVSITLTEKPQVSNLGRGCFVFLANQDSCFWLMVTKISTAIAKKVGRRSWKALC